ncbi:MAG: SDR family NAD(P)-dependent oxidoreductase [Chloroflexota bacterium]
MNAEMYGLEGKVAIVTGAGSGIGQGVAREMVRVGGKVVVADIDGEAAEQSAARLKELGGEAEAVHADVTDEGSVGSMLGAAIDAFGGVDILVNNVGGLGGKPRMTPIVDMGLEQWEAVIRLNLTSQFLCSRACIRYWVDKGRRGNIVNVSSLAAMVPYETSVAYGAAKAGVVNLTSTLAAQYGKHGIRVNCIAPGHVRTPVTDELYRGREDVRAAQDRIIPVGRYGEPEELGRVAVFLASDASSYVTGQTLLVSGGMYYFLTRLP